MAWNGSNGAADASRKGERRRVAGSGAPLRLIPSTNGKSPLRGILAALFVVIGAGIAWWLVSRPASTEPAPEPAPEAEAAAEPETADIAPEPEAVPVVPVAAPVEGSVETAAAAAAAPEASAPTRRVRLRVHRGK